jgi:hypothetical protein
VFIKRRTTEIKSSKDAASDTFPVQSKNRQCQDLKRAATTEKKAGGPCEPPAFGTLVIRS